jgi:hypothetical protein
MSCANILRREAPNATRRASSLWQHASSQQESCDVCTRDQQQQENRTKEHEQHSSQVTNHTFVQRDESQRPGFIFRVRDLELPRDRVHLCLRLPHRHTKVETANQSEEMEPPHLVFAIIERDWRVKIDGIRQSNEGVERKSEAARHDANNGANLVVNPQCLAERLGRTPELLTPQPLADDDWWFCSASFLVRTKVAPENGGNAERRHQTRADGGHVQTLGAMGSDDVHRHRGDDHRAQGSEEVFACPVIEEIRRRDGGAVRQLERSEHPDELLRTFVRQRLEQHAVDRGEHCRGPTDAEREHRGDHDGEEWLPRGEPNRITPTSHE